jgi:hypothetical protein
MKNPAALREFEDLKAISMKQKAGLDGERMRALTALAESLDGCTEAMMLEHGHSIETIIGLIDAGLASLLTEHRGRPVEVARVKITAKGQLAVQTRRPKIESHDEAVKAALKAYPQLTHEEAEEITTAFGF